MTTFGIILRFPSESHELRAGRLLHPLTAMATLVPLSKSQVLRRDTGDSQWVSNPLYLQRSSYMSKTHVLRMSGIHSCHPMQRGALLCDTMWTGVPLLLCPISVGSPGRVYSTSFFKMYEPSGTSLLSSTQVFAKGDTLNIRCTPAPSSEAARNKWEHLAFEGDTPGSALLSVNCVALCLITFKMRLMGTSLVAQWLRIRLPVQGTRVRALVREDPTCRGATKPVRHNY